MTALRPPKFAANPHGILRVSQRTRRSIGAGLRPIRGNSCYTFEHQNARFADGYSLPSTIPLRAIGFGLVWALVVGG
jgi:hypothetical protein